VLRHRPEFGRNTGISLPACEVSGLKRGLQTTTDYSDFTDRKDINAKPPSRQAAKGDEENSSQFFEL
jgi:hypothetical protein